MTNNRSENNWDEFTKTGKLGPFMENLIAEFFQFSVKIIKNMFWVATITPKISDTNSSFLVK